MKKLITAFLMVLFLCTWAGAETFYVNASASGANDGSSDTDAWEAFSDIVWDTSVGEVNEGDSLLLKEGEIWREQLTVGGSGSSGNVITIGSYGTDGNDPIISGANLITTWSVVSGNIYSAAYAWVTVTKQVFEDGARLIYIGSSYIRYFDDAGGGELTVVTSAEHRLSNGDTVTIAGTTAAYYDGEYVIANVDTDSFEITHAYSGSNVGLYSHNGTWSVAVADAINDLVAGSWTLDDTNDLLYVWATDNADPDEHTIEISLRSHPIKILQKSYVTINGLNLTKGQYAGVDITDLGGSSTTHHIIVENCTLSYAYEQNIWLHAGATGATIRNSDLSYAGGGGIITNDVNNIMISGNTIHHNGQLSEVWPNHNIKVGVRIYGQATTNTIVERNEVYSQNGAGIHFDYSGESDTSRIIRYNDVHDNGGSGIYIEYSTWYANVYYNRVYSNTYHGIKLQKQIENSKVYNNTIYSNGGNGIDVVGTAVANGMANNLIKNNISVGNIGYQLRASYGGNNDDGKGTGNVYLNNCFGTESAAFIIVDSDVEKDTYDEWEAAYGSSTSSAEADPLFVDAANNDFHPQPSSPCKDAGTDVSLSIDYDSVTVGDPPEIGAYEYISPKMSPTLKTIINLLNIQRN